MKWLIENFVRKIGLLFFQVINTPNHELLRMANLEAANFIKELPEASQLSLFSNRKEIHNFLIEKLQTKELNSLVLEFGVYKGRSIKYFGKQLPQHKIVGFDSFLGLNAAFGGYNAPNLFNRQGKVPKNLPSNIQLEIGWIEDTLPKFINNNEINPVLIHLDLDTYEATSIVLQLLQPFLQKGTYILFDELIGNPLWQHGEFRALNENLNKEHYRFIAFGPNQALLEIHQDN